MNFIGGSAFWRNWFPDNAPFIKSMFGIQLRRVAVALMLTAFLFLIYKKTSRFFLGYLLSKSMIETRGLFWDFFIHFGRMLPYSHSWLLDPSSLAVDKTFLINHAFPFQSQSHDMIDPRRKQYAT